MLQAVTGVAIGTGVLLCVFAFMLRGFFTRPTPFSNSAVQSEYSEIVDALKKQVKELNEKLELAKQEKKHTEKAGPFGTVKSKVNPTVTPDESINPRLAEMLSRIAINKELIVALANSNVQPLLQIWFTTIKRLGMSNYLVVALDDSTVQFCKANDVPFYKNDPDEDIDSAGKSPIGPVVSALKFKILREFLQMGYNVLLSDTDVIFLQNPFDHLYRDSDIESMSDGHDTWSAHGCNHDFDDPEFGPCCQHVYTTRIWSFNSGFFYIRATVPGIELLDRVTESLRRRPGAWDQALYNEELFFPSHPDYVGLTAAKRVMDIYLFLNSKTLFKTVRKDPDLRKTKPVVVHINYHRDKLPRMKAAIDFYANGKDDALEPFLDGSRK
ncbi:hypothetical protein ACS0TY_011688 [Phlomoides rotata]